MELTGIGFQYGNIKANKYKYQGKELLDDLNLNIYDFHARGYDPVIGRTWQLDPHAENYFSLSRYSWTANNPILNIDPNGKDWYRHDETGAVLWRDRSDNSIQVNNESFRNIGAEYSFYSEGLKIDYNQNSLISTTEVSSELNLAGGQFIPSQFTTDDGNVVKVDFSFVTKDGNNADNAIDKNAVSQLITGVNEANNEGAGIRSIGISATTNGEHSPTSNHYVKNGARAIDIATVNNVNTGNSSIRGSVVQIQSGLNKGTMIRENFGPALKTKNGSPVSVAGHTNHIHFSVNKK